MSLSYVYVHIRPCSLSRKASQKGAKGKDVEHVQRTVSVKVDGSFGPATIAAVKSYQKRHGLVVDGFV